MTHNIIHDEEKREEIVDRYCLNVFRPIPHALSLSAKSAMTEYAEHTLVKFIDSEVDMLEKSRQKPHIHERHCKSYEECEKFSLFETSYNHAITDQIAHLRELKAQLTKSR